MVLGLLVLLFSGCKSVISQGVTGRVTSADPGQGISGVKIIYSGSRSGTTTTHYRGEWFIPANDGEWLVIKAEKPHFMFHPLEMRVVVGRDNHQDFKVVAFRDDFEDPSSGWLVDYDYKYTTDKEDNIYLMKTTNYLAVTAPVKSSTCYTAQATMYKDPFLGSGNGKYGLIFNMTTFDDIHYAFCVNSEGMYEIVEFVNRIPTVKHSGTHPYISTVNILGVDQNGTNVVLYLNGGWVGELTVYDHGNVDSLHVGLYAEANSGTYYANYDDFKLTSLGLRLLPQFRQLDINTTRVNGGNKTE